MAIDVSPSNRMNARTRRTILGTAACAIAAAAVLGACTSKGAGATVKVTSKNAACELSSSTVGSGKTTFEVTNAGSDVTEVYVYAAGNRIMGEVENIGPGSTREFTVDLGGGDYEVACKPGQKGDGIRTDLKVTGSAKENAAPSRSVAITAHEWGYSGFEMVNAKKGETIEFEFTNNGTLDHEMEFLDPDGKAVGEIGPTKPGASGDVVITFAESGKWTVECGIEGHLEHGMKYSMVVA